MSKTLFVRIVATLGLVAVAVVLAVRFFAREPLSPPPTQSLTLQDGLALYVDPRFVRRVNRDTDTAVVEEALSQVRDRVASLAGEDIADAAAKYLHLFVAEDYDDARAEWQRLGIQPATTDHYLGEWEDSLQDKHNRRRAFLLAARFHTEAIEVMDGGVPREDRSRYYFRRERSLEGRYPEEAFGPGDTDPPARVVLVLPGSYATLKGEPYEGAFTLELAYASGLGEWVVWEVAMYVSHGNTFEFLLPIFS